MVLLQSALVGKAREVYSAMSVEQAYSATTLNRLF